VPRAVHVDRELPSSWGAAPPRAHPRGGCSAYIVLDRRPRINSGHLSAAKLSGHFAAEALYMLRHACAYMLLEYGHSGHLWEELQAVLAVTL
jgi:hypothetical protein